ncbi:MAG: magnesium transporter [Acidobacteria bacterium]|nr:MAG: magnesium transporter [Acidobacteriota bacterium]
MPETFSPPDVHAIVAARDFGRLRHTLEHWAPSGIAKLLEDLPVDERALVFRLLPRKLAAEVFEYFPVEAQEPLLKAMAKEELTAILNEMAPDDRTALFDELPAKVTQQMLALLSPSERAIAVSLLGYPEGSIGRLMTPDYVRVRPEWTVELVIQHIRIHGRDSETLSLIYVIDENNVLIDDIRIRKVLLAPPKAKIAELLDHRFVALKATDDQETAIQVFRNEDRYALPVTDSGGVLIGIVTIDDVLDVAQDEATEDIQKIGGTEALDEPYMDTPLHRMVRKRATWLAALFLGEMFTATAMGYFEEEIQRAVVLALFVPLIISSGGNSGSQASTLVIRALALGEISLHDWWRVVRREFFSGLALGAILGSIGFLRITLWSVVTNLYGEHWFLVAMTVAFSLVGVVLWGTMAGSMLPFVMRRLGFDPAASSAPFVATLVDVSGLVIYFTIAALILSGTLL